MDNHRVNKLGKRWAFWCGCLSVALGVIVLLGRFAGWHALVSIIPDGAPMAFATAVGFLICGAGFVTYELGLRKSSVAAGAGGVVLGAGTLLLYVAAAQLGVFEHFKFSPTRLALGVGFDGNLSPNTAACFALVGCALVMLNLKRLHARALLATASILFAVSALALIGYATGARASVSWWRYTGMALHTSFGFMAVAMAIFTAVLSRVAAVERASMRSLALFLAAGVLLVVVGFTASVSNRQQQRANEWVAHTADVLAALKALDWNLMRLGTEHRRFSTAKEPIPSTVLEGLAGDVQAEFAALKKLVADNQDQLTIVVGVGEQIDRQVANVRQTLAERGVVPVLNLTGSIRQKLNSISERERELFIARRSDSNRATVQTERVILLGNGLAAMLAALAFFFTRRSERARTRAEAALRESEERARLTIDSVHDYAILRLDVHGAVASWNSGAQRHKGYTADEIIGRNFSLFYTPEDVAAGKPAAALAAAMLHGHTESEGWRVRKDGSRFWGNVVITALREADGSLIGYTKVTRDITESRRIEQAFRTSEARFRTAFDSAGIGTAMIDLKGRWLKVNSALCEIVGYTEDVLREKTFQEITHPEDLAADLSLVKDLLEGRRRSYQMEKRYLHRDGHVVWARLTVSLVYDEEGQPANFVSQVEDITEHRKLIMALARTRDEALTASRHKSEFLANMSHEIRTPMNGVIGMTNLLLDTSLTQEQRELGRTIQQSADNLLVIINDILDFSKIEAGKLSIEQADFDLQQTVEDTLALLAPRAHEKRLELLFDFDARITWGLQGDAVRIRQVLTNLIGNAVKFTSEGEVVVKVSLQADEPSGSTVRIEVRDTGIGIPAEARSQLFQPFMQVDGTTTRRYGGTGLGLAISRQLIGLMGGEIGLDSTAGSGSVFWFQLKLPRAEGYEPERLPALPVGLRVLVVDDNETSRRIFREQITNFGVRVETAASAADALVLIKTAVRRNAPYDLVFVDWIMPRMDGISLSVEIRADPEIAGTALVMTSASKEAADPFVWDKLQFRALLIKPVREALLHRTLRETTLKRAKGPLPALPLSEDAAPATDEALRFLIVEDNKTNQLVARRTLEKAGFRVDVADNGLVALKRLEVVRYDAILMDCQMPEMDGYTATARIRAGTVPGLDPKIPIIALTAYAMPGDREKCLAAGMDEYVTKPLRLDDLNLAMQRLGLHAHGPTLD